MLRFSTHKFSRYLSRCDKNCNRIPSKSTFIKNPRKKKRNPRQNHKREPQNKKNIRNWLFSNHNEIGWKYRQNISKSNPKRFSRSKMHGNEKSLKKIEWTKIQNQARSDELRAVGIANVIVVVCDKPMTIGRVYGDRRVVKMWV